MVVLQADDTCRIGGMVGSLSTLLARLKDDPYLLTAVEEGTRQGAILPTLAALGWDRDNVREVVPEFQVANGKVDYCLRVGNQNYVFIEVKRASEQLENHEEQLLEYAFRNGVGLAVLTNGITWWFYLPLLSGSWEQRKFYALDIREHDTEAAATNMQRFLGREVVADGSARRSAEEEYSRKDKLRIIADSLPRAWRDLCQNPDEALIELLAEKVESVCGHRPDADTVTGFLINQVSLATSIGPITRYRSNLTRTSIPERATRHVEVPIPNSLSANAPPVPISSFAKTKPKAYKLLGNYHEVSGWRDVLLGVALFMHRAHPETFITQAMALTGRKRPYFSNDMMQMAAPKMLGDTGIFAETNLNADQIMARCRQLLLLFGYARNDLVVDLVDI